MLRRSLVRVGAVALACALAWPAAPVAAGTTVTQKAVDWLKTQQQADGSFEVAGFPGFETLDAVLALAANAQTGPTWSTTAARAAVNAATLAHLDDLAETAACPPTGRAAKLIVLVAVPLGFNPAAFDPAGDGTPVDLAALADDPDCTSVFSDVLYRVLANGALDQTIDPADVQAIRDAQQANGGWNFAGNPDDTQEDPDMTGLAVRALVAAGADADDPAVDAALALFAETEAANGGWPSPFTGETDDPNSTAMAMLALLAAGIDPGLAPACALERRQQDDGRISSPLDEFGVNSFPTSQAVQALALADAPKCPDLGHRLAAADGGVFAFGNATYHGSMGGVRLNQPVVGIASTPSGKGYWLVAADGGVFAFGDARFFGSMGGVRLNQPVVGMAATPTGQGYWLVARDGGVFAFGDARFRGSMGGVRLNQPVVGMAAAGDAGYWLVAADGGIFAFGAGVGFFGSTGGVRLNQPVVGMAAAADGNGYWLVAADGGVFNFGPGAGFFGAGRASGSRAPVIGMLRSFNGLGYRFAGADAFVHGHGNQTGSPVVGACGCGTLQAPIVGIAH